METMTPVRQKALDSVKDLTAKGLSIKAALKEAKISPSTYYKAVRLNVAPKKKGKAVSPAKLVGVKRAYKRRKLVSQTVVAAELNQHPTDDRTKIVVLLGEPELIRRTLWG